MLYRAVSATAVTTAGPLEPPWQSGAHLPDGAWIGHIVHPYTSPQLRNAIHAFRSLTKAKEAPTERRAHRLGMVCPPRHDTAMYTAFGRVTDDTPPEPCCAVSVSLQLIQHAVAIQHYSSYKIQLATPSLRCPQCLAQCHIVRSPHPRPTTEDAPSAGRGRYRIL